MGHVTRDKGHGAWDMRQGTQDPGKCDVRGGKGVLGPGRPNLEYGPPYKRLVAKTIIMITKEDLVNAKADIIKWMVIFWVGQLAAMAAIVKLIH
jgi:hypothetical protein